MTGRLPPAALMPRDMIALARAGFRARGAVLPNVIPSPHIGSGPLEARHARGYRTPGNIGAARAGRASIDPTWS